jgi:hypothetical protein
MKHGLAGRQDIHPGYKDALVAIAARAEVRAALATRPTNLRLERDGFVMQSHWHESELG